MLDGKPVGFATASAMHPPEVGIAVHPDVRLRGIGRSLLDRMRGELTALGHREALLISERKSETGAAFLARIGAEYRFSEFRLERNEGPHLQINQIDLI